MPQDIYADPVWQDVSAVRSRRVYKVPLGGYRWDPPGQESPLMWHWLTDIAFPRQQSGLRGKVTEYFRFLYNHEPTGRRAGQDPLDGGKQRVRRLPTVQCWMTPGSAAG